MTDAAQQHLDIRAPARAYSEPQEREDPRNVLIDAGVRQTVDLVESAARNDVLDVLLKRFDTAVPELARRLAPLLVPQPAIAPPTPEPSRAPSVDPLETELKLTRHLAALNEARPRSAAGKALVDGAKADVLADLEALRARPRRPAPRQPVDGPKLAPLTAPGAWEHDAGSGE